MDVLATRLLAAVRSHLDGPQVPGMPLNGPHHGQPGSDLFNDVRIWPSVNPVHALAGTVTVFAGRAPSVFAGDCLTVNLTRADSLIYALSLMQ
jgi:hypothetical protein